LIKRCTRSQKTGVPRFNLVLTGRAKKNWKSADLILAALYRLVAWKSDGGNQCYVLANDEDQAGDDLKIAKKLVEVNPLLSESLVVKQKVIERYADDDLKREREPIGFLDVLKEYGVKIVTGDRYAGDTFKAAFQDEGITYRVSQLSKHQLYEALEPRLNSSLVLLLDHTELESQLLSLIWRGNRIDHPNGEHDDFANAAAGAVELALGEPAKPVEEQVAIFKAKPEIIQATTDIQAIGMDACQREFWKEITGGR
jgi:hypothetical protein